VEPFYSGVPMREISHMNLDELFILRDQLKNSSDPYAIGAIKFVEAEIRRAQRNFLTAP
jgi:hypothetical protein